MLPVGTLLRAGSYRIERQISSGGFGNTYVVRNISFDEVYAMKEFFMKGVNLRNGSDVTVSITDNKTTFESQRNKFKKEAKRLRKLNNPHIVKVHDLFDENGTVYYVMDLIDGHTLSDIVKKDGPMSEEMAMNIFWQILEALDVVHNQNPMMLHLDIKPSNIMVDKSGNAYLLDFGSSKQVDSDHNMTSSAFTMTPGYAPSELIDHNPNRIGPWTDLYELGATIYHLLTGQQPPTISEISEEGNDAFSFPKTISNKTREYILWLMSLSRTKRPKSVRDVYGLYAITQSGEEDNKGEDKDHDKTVIGPSKNMTSGGDETVLSNQENNTSSMEVNESINSPKQSAIKNSNDKKVVMSVTGIALILFLTLHGCMNIVALFSEDDYNMICEFLGANWYAVLATLGLATLAVIHIVYAFILTAQKRTVHGDNRYEVAKVVNAGKVGRASKNMLVLGIIILLGLLFHLWNFWYNMMFADLVGALSVIDPADGFAWIREVFANPVFVVLYIIWLVAIWFHLTHGFWSAIQTLGWSSKISQKRWMNIGNVYVTLLMLCFLVVVLAFAFGCAPSLSLYDYNY